MYPFIQKSEEREGVDPAAVEAARKGGGERPRELTWRASLLAALLTVTFGTASGYLGLQIGMTFAASIPAAVMAVAILRSFFRDSTLLESNIVQTQASAGEAVMGGVVYMIPALIFLQLNPTLTQIGVLTLAGGLLGIFLMIPLRDYFVRREHARLPYPEGTACAAILRLGEEAGGQARRVLQGMAVGAAYNLATAEGLRLFSGQILLSSQRLWGAVAGVHLTPLMLGVGFLVGAEVGWTMLGGALAKGLVIIPLLNWMGRSASGAPPSPSEVEFAVRMIGAGAVATGGLISIVRMAPQMKLLFQGGFGGIGRQAGAERQQRVDQDLRLRWVVLGLAAALLLVLAGLNWSGPQPAAASLLAVPLILILGFFFVALCARLVGILGTSSYPLSGLTIGALLVVVLVLRLSGLSGAGGMAAAIILGAVICVAIATTADISQDLKTGSLVGATPYRQQQAELIGILMTAFLSGSIVMLFHASGELARLPAPQARMMAAIVEGVMTDQFQWGYAAVGAAIAVAAELAGVSSILLAVGIYLPVPLASAFILGGALRSAFDRRNFPEETKQERQQEGTLFASGLIAGWALMGVGLVILVALREFGFVQIQLALRELPPPGLSGSYLLDLLLSMVFFLAVAAAFWRLLTGRADRPRA